MYEMQGPHGSTLAADLPIPRPSRDLSGPHRSPQSLHIARSPGLRTFLEVAPEVACCVKRCVNFYCLRH
jgi:hypothetical protein